MILIKEDQACMQEQMDHNFKGLSDYLFLADHENDVNQPTKGFFFSAIICKVIIRGVFIQKSVNW